MNEYLCCKKEAAAEIEIEKSKFIAFAYGIISGEDACNRVSKLRKEYYDASHVCYAYVVNGGGKSSDDGEPHSTAGLPILSALNGYNNTLVAVVRYFGGVKLGTGGLSRAYRQAAVEVLKKAGVSVYKEAKDFEIVCGYAAYKMLFLLLKNERVRILSEEFLDMVTVCFTVPNEGVKEILTKITAIMPASEIRMTGEQMRPF